MASDPDAADGGIDPAALQEVSDWIVARGLSGRELAPLMDELCPRLQRIGVDIWRLHASMATLHPTFSALGSTWWRDRGAQAESYARADEQEDEWLQSPLRHMIEADLPRMRRRLQGPDATLDFPALREFRDQGASDWMAWLIRFGGDDQATGLPGMLLSIASDRPGGFSDAEIAAVERLLPRLALACYRIGLEQVAGNLLDAYVGAEAGRRVLAGQIERGAAEPIEAAVLLADLRGFTALADRIPGGALLAALNAYLGELADTVEAHGGQVLKFLGDGLLAIFSLQGRDPAAVCADALAAAQAARAGNARLNAARRAEGLETLELDVALHLGELTYGNVGSAGRLDFTAIGPAVNEASRIEALCQPLGAPLAISASFAAAHGGPLRSLGRHRLRGLDRAQELFAPA